MQGKGINTKPLGGLLEKRHKKVTKNIQKKYKKGMKTVQPILDNSIKIA